uniref:hypothetical protein n=1 Tax=Ezakiella massiliensis TaxID=1852374 RepID=UPI00094F142F|nr:hypothetical protein [Ezakiella massiliensis]
MQSINDSINKIRILKVTSIIALILLSILLFFKGIIPLKKEIDNIKEKIQESSVQLRSNGTPPEEELPEVDFDNKKYDDFYNEIVEFSRLNNLDYMSLENTYDNFYGNTSIYPMVTNSRLEMSDIYLLDNLKSILPDKLLDFTLIKDDKVHIDLKNLFLFDKSFSHKDLTIDNRITNLLEDDMDETGDEGSDENNDSKSESNSNMDVRSDTNIVEKKEEFALIDFREENFDLLCTPMHQNISVEGKYQVNPNKNYQSYIVNIYNNSDENGSALVSFKNKSVKFFTGEIDVLLKCDLFNNISRNLELCVTDYYGEIKNISGNYLDGKFIFHVEDKYNFPIEIYGIKFNIPDKSSTSFALENLNLEIKSDIYNEIQKNGIIRTVSKEGENSIDEFIDSISGGVIKEELINDNQLKESEFKDRKVFLVRFRNIYEIK